MYRGIVSFGRLRALVRMLTCMWLVAASRGEHSPLWPVDLNEARGVGIDAPAALGVDVALLEDGPGRPMSLDGSPAVSGAPAEWWFDGGLTAAPDFTVDDGVFQDHVEVGLYSGTVDAVIIYTTADMDQADAHMEPSLDWRGVVGTVYDGVPLVVSRSTVIKAVAVHMDAMDSDVVERRIVIKNAPPVFSIVQGTFDDVVTVTISATSSESSASPYIAATVDGTDPYPGNPLGIGTVDLVIRNTSKIRAIAFQDGMHPSDVSSTGVLQVSAPVLEEQRSWRGTVAWWSLGDSTYHFGKYSRGRVRWGGACDEQYPSEIYPARIAARDGVLGDAVLTGPGCKGGVWDINPGGVSACDVHPLVFNGSLGSSGYKGRAEAAVSGAACAVSRQPNLDAFAQVHRGVKGLRFDTVNRGLLVADAVDQLVRERKLPTDAFSLEVHMTVGNARAGGRQVRALAAAQQDSAGLMGDGVSYSKGWSLLYETDEKQQTVMLRFSMALEANNVRNGQGRIRTLTHSMPVEAFVHQQWTHVVAVYDLHTLALYVNGTLAAQEAACHEAAKEGVAGGGCGGIQYPMVTDPQAREPTPLTLGMYENRQTGLSVAHEGMLAEVRMFREALPAHIIASAALRLLLGNPEGHCREGGYGVYQGLQPCQACAAGSYSSLPRRDECELCARGTWQATEGQKLCLSCPVRMTTAAPGAPTEDACEEPDECASWSGLANDCHANATCSKVPGSFVCTCNEWYEGDGKSCHPVCGDGRVMPGEPCDDGNRLDSDGCSSSCTVEEGFSCPAPPSSDLASVCECLEDGEVCCARAYVKCLLESSRFTPDNHGHESAGIGSDGCAVVLVEDRPTHHMARPGESCHAACSSLPSPAAPDGGEFECVAHSTREAEVDYLQSVSLPAALGGQGGASSAVGQPAQGGGDAWECSRVVTSTSNTGAAGLLEPEVLPMVDEFSLSGARAVGNGFPNRELICYARAPGLPVLAPTPGSGSPLSATDWCGATPTIATGRRLARPPWLEAPPCCLSFCSLSSSVTLVMLAKRKSNKECRIFKYTHTYTPPPSPMHAWRPSAIPKPHGSAWRKVLWLTVF